MKILGIDNGLSGGLVMLDGRHVVEAEVMPVCASGKGNEYDLRIICEYLRAWTPDLVILEKAQAYPKQGGVSNFTTGMCYGIMRGILGGMQIPFDIVHPKTWQKVAFEGMAKTDTKAMSYQVCSRLWPSQDWRASERCKKPHDGLTDAAMLAEYGRRVHGV